MKKIWKKGLVAILAAATVLTAAGCKKNEGEQEGQARKEFYYVPEYKELGLSFDYIDRIAAKGDEAVIAASSWDDETGEGERYFYHYNLLTGESRELPLAIDENTYISDMTVNSSGNLFVIANTSVPVNGEGEVITEEEDTAEESTAEDAEAEETEGESAEAEGVETEEGTDESGEESDTGEAEAEVTGTSGEMVVSTGAGSVIGSLGAAADASPVEYKNYLELWEVSFSDGELLNKIDLAGVFDDPNNAYIQYMAIDDKDNLYLTGGDSQIYIIDKAGAKVGSIAVDNWIDSLFATKEGKVYIKQWGTEGPELYPVELQTKTLGAAIKSTVFSDSDYNQKFYKGRESGLLISDSKGVYTYSVDTDEKTDLFEWLDADINSDDVEEVIALSDGRFFVVLREFGGENPEYSVAYLTKTPASEMPEKEELLYGTMWLSQDVRKNIIDFNKSSEEYHISVKEYAGNDYQAGMTQFNNDVTGGNCPDIIDLSSIDFSQYAGKGVFADMYPYMEKDGVAKEDYLENVLKAYEMNGKLYGLIPQFYITTTAAKVSNVGNEGGWTLSEMLDFVESKDAENVFQYGSRMSIFYYCIYNNIDEFINWETGECTFNSEDFIRVLEFAAKFPEEPDYESDGEGISSKLRDDKILLMQSSVSSVQEYQMMNGLFGGDISFIGYPNKERKGNLIQPSGGAVAISAKSKLQDGAWAYVKTLLSEEYQDSLISEHGGSFGFPVKKSTLDKQFELDMKPDYYEDENGERVERPKTTWGYDDFEIEIYAATQEEVDAVKAVIASAEKVSGSVNEELITIITEETEAFFKNQKNAKDTADIIQNRIQIYVNEHR